MTLLDTQTLGGDKKIAEIYTCPAKYADQPIIPIAIRFQNSTSILYSEIDIKTLKIILRNEFKQNDTILCLNFISDREIMILTSKKTLIYLIVNSSHKLQ